MSATDNTNLPAAEPEADEIIAAPPGKIGYGLNPRGPIVILLLSALGIVNPRMLKKFRRHAFVGCLIASALITPGSDVTALAALTVSLYLLYELSIGLSALVTRRRERSIATAAVEGA